MSEGFFGAELQPNHPLRPKIPPNATLRVTQIALPAASNGRLTVTLAVENKKFTLCTLDAAAKIYQVGTDLVFTSQQEPTFVALGGGKVHITGWIEYEDMEEHDDEEMAGGPQEEFVRGKKRRRDFSDNDSDDEEEEDEEDLDDDGLYDDGSDDDDQDEDEEEEEEEEDEDLDEEDLFEEGDEEEEGEEDDDDDDE